MKDFIVPDDCQILNLKEIYQSYFGNIDNGFFVEVGAYDGRSWTNTGFLADIGWKGIYIEPIKSHMDMCKENHKNNDLIFEQVGIGSVEGLSDMYLSGGLSTVVEEVNRAHEIIYKQSNLQKETITVKTLHNIFQKHNVKNNFELLVVDTEGYEKEVFDSFNLQLYRPKMMIVELCDIHDAYSPFINLQDNAKKVRTHILNNGYTTIYEDCINTIFWSH